MDWSKFLQPRQFPERNLGTSLAREFPYRAHVYSDARIPKRIAPLGMGNLFHARAGVQAALMASFGFDSVADEIDRFGEAYDVAMLTQSPTPFHYMTGEMELKPWVCSRHGQGAMQALESLVSTHGIGARDITAVRLHLSNMYLRPHQHEPAPDTYWEAIYSTQWAATMVLQDIPAGPQWVTAERFADPFSRHLAALVDIVEDPASSAADRELRWLDIRGIAEVDAGGQTYKESRHHEGNLRQSWRRYAGGYGRREVLRNHGALPGARARGTATGGAQNRRSAADINDIAALL